MTQSVYIQLCSVHMYDTVYIQLYSVLLYKTAIYRPWSYRRKSPVRFVSQNELAARTSITNVTFWHVRSGALHTNLASFCGTVSAAYWSISLLVLSNRRHGWEGEWAGVRLGWQEIRDHRKKLHSSWDLKELWLAQRWTSDSDWDLVLAAPWTKCSSNLFNYF